MTKTHPKTLRGVRSTIRRFSLYVKNHNLLVRYQERRKGITKTLAGWVCVGFTGVSFNYALKTSNIPGTIAVFYQSLAMSIFLFMKCWVTDGLDVLKVVEKTSLDPQHFTVRQRRYSLAIRGCLGILAGVAFEYSKTFSTIIDNSTIFGADALVVAFLMRFVLKEKLGWRWPWICLAFLGVLTIVYSDFHTLDWTRSVIGSLVGAFSTLCFAVVFLMTSYMVHHDKPITIAFYQGIAALVFSMISLVGSVTYLFFNNDYEQIYNYFSFFQTENIFTLPVLFLTLGGVVYAWALPLFFEAFYYTETLILATLGYFLSPIVSMYEFLFFGSSEAIWLNKWSILFITAGTGGLLWYENRAKKKNALFIVPQEESIQENLHSIVLDFKNRKIDKFYYLSHMYEYNRILYIFSDLIKKSSINKIIIDSHYVEYEVTDPSFTFQDDVSMRSPSFEILNFGRYEPEICEFLKMALDNGSIIFDIGAGTGWYALSFASFFKDSTIYAFEPIKALFNILKTNLQRNKIENVTAFNYGISDKNGTHVFHYLKNQHDYLKNILQPLEIEAPVKSFTDIINGLDLSKIDFIKQELKFSERPFTTGNNNLIQKYLPMIMFSFREYWNEEMIEHFHISTCYLDDLGYRKVTFLENARDGVSESHCFFYHPSQHAHINQIDKSKNEARN